MPHLNSRLYALLAMGLSLLGAPGAGAQTTGTSPQLRGDVNGDGQVTRADADAVRAYLVRGTLPGGRSILPAGDANGDGRVTAADAALISRFAAGVDVSRFPVGRPVGEGGPGQNGGAAYITVEYECTVDVSARSTECRTAGPATGPNGPRLDVVSGTGPLTFVSNWVHSRGSTVDEDTSVNTLSFTNNMGQPIGTIDGVSPDPVGNRLFFAIVPYVKEVYSGTVASATIALVTPDGTASFVNPDGTMSFPNRPYYSYSGVVTPGATSTSRTIQYIYSANVKKFTYGYRVSTPVQYPDGRITVSPATAPVLTPGDSTKFTGTSYSAFGEVLVEEIAWSSSDEAVATVTADGWVKANAEGSATITVTSAVKAQRTGTRVITVDNPPTVASTSPESGAEDVPANSDIVINFSEAVDVTGASFSLACPAGSPQAFTAGGTGTSTITLNPDADLPANTTCTVTVVAAQVSDTDTNDGATTTTMASDYVFSFKVAIKALADIFADTVVGNVTVNTAHTSPAFNVLENDQVTGTTKITFWGWSGNSGATQNGGTVVVDTTGEGTGTFIYDPPAGYEGPDSFQYTVQSGTATSTATVSLTVAGMIWFVRADAEECSTNCGRRANPFKSLGTFSTANLAGGGSNPADNEAVFVFEGTYPNPVSLRAGQKLIGQDAKATLETLTGYNFPELVSVPATNGGSGQVNLTGSDGVNLAPNNALYGFTVSTTAGEGIGSPAGGFGTLKLASGADADVAIASSGQALALSTGTLNGDFASVGSTGGTNNVNLTAVNTTGTVSLGGGVLSGATGDGFVIANGAGSFTYTGTISNAAARAVNVSGKSGGTTTFSGNINPGAPGGGIAVASNTGGTVTFSGTAKNLSSGTAAGVSLTGNSAAATIAFTGGGLTISTSTGAGFTASGAGTVTVTGAGNTIATGTGTALSLSSVSTGESVLEFANVSANGAVNGIVLSGLTGVGVKVSGGTIQGTTSPAVSLTNLTGITGQVELTGMALSRTSGTGAVISGSSFGTLALGSTTVSASGGPGAINLTTGTLSGTIPSIAASGVTAGTHAVSLTGVGGTYTVSGGTVNGTSNGDALRVSGGNAVATWNNTLTATSAGGRSVNIASTTGGSYTFANPVTAGNASAGVSITGNAASVTMPGLTLGTSGARFGATPLTLQMGAGNVSLGGVSIFTTGGSATGLAMTSAAGAGTLSVASGIIDAVGSPAVNVAPSSGSQPLSIALTTVNANGGTSGVILNGTSGNFTVTGTGSAANSGGIIQNTSGNAISLTSASNVQMSLMSLQPDATGWLGTNLSGTNGLSRSTVDYLGTAPGGAYAFRVANTNTNATITLDGTTFQNKMDGTTSVSISALGSSVITFNAIDSNTGDAFPSRYRNLFGSGIVVGSGDDVGSTAVVTANVSNTTFQDAPSNGLNNLELGVTQNATLIPNITGNTFDKVALPLATVGVINLNATVMGRVGSNAASGVISNNTISNIRSGAGPTFAYDPAGTNGYVGMRIAIDNNAGGVNHKLQILNNTVTNVARQGLLVSARGAANNVNVLVQGNTIGTLAAPVGTPSARRGVEIEAQTTATLKVQVMNNPSIVGGTSGANSALAIRAGVNAGATSTVQATVTGNTIANPNAGTNDGRFRAETVSGNSGTMCLDLRNNVLESAAKEFQTNNNGGTYGRNASGNTGTITTVGAVGAVASCTLPSF